MATPTFDDYGASGSDGQDPRLVNLIGGIISLIVFLIIVGWGANTLMRDASGVPVVEAIDGPIREAPQDPGGVQAAHQGLSVNAVASGAGNETSFTDETRLAPAPTTLQDEDAATAVLQSMAPQSRPFGLQTATAPLAADASAITRNASLQQMVSNMNAAMAPVSDLEPRAASIDAAVSLEQTAPTAAAPIASTSPMAVAQSMRPVLRPSGVVAATRHSSLAPLPSAAAPAARADGFIKDVPVGTPLAQMGAFDSKEIAMGEWARLQGKFSDYLVGKDPVIQTSQSDGKTWFRLRVMGFETTEATRQFCSAIAGRGAACYPVVMR